jgi:CO/xanthine dehydrogenase Mo-binding subunit
MGKQARRSPPNAVGTIVVSVGATVPLVVLSQARAALTQGTEPPPHRDALDSYVAIFADGNVLAYFRRLDTFSEGRKTSVAHMIAELLSIRRETVSVYGGVHRVDDLHLDSQQLRFAAADLRRYLFWLAAKKLGAPADQLEVTDGIVSVRADTARSITFTDLIGSQYINNCSTDYSTE